MQIKIPSSKINLEQLIKRCGYAEIRNRQGQKSFVRRIRGDQYPRFHVYLEKGHSSGSGTNQVINLHLDQKKPIYSGVTAHSGEYDTAVVKKEGARIEDLIIKYISLEKNS
jgi:hypothetical protein